MGVPGNVFMPTGGQHEGRYVRSRQRRWSTRDTYRAVARGAPRGRPTPSGRSLTKDLKMTTDREVTDAYEKGDLTSVKTVGSLSMSAAIQAGKVAVGVGLIGAGWFNYDVSTCHPMRR